jgi:Tryptophan-associated transmembrane protein (Trp_oprn_chp)
MDRSQARGAAPVAPILMIAGAALILIGCVLPWFTVSADFTRFGAAARSITGNGMDTSDGPLFLVIAIGIAILGIVALIGKSRSVRLTVSVIAALGALFVGVIAIYNALTPKSQAIDEITKELGGGAAAIAVRRFVENLFDRGIIHIGVDVGLWIVVIGAVGALVGSLMAAVTAGSIETAPTYAVAPAAAAVAEWSGQAATPTPAGAPAPMSGPAAGAPPGAEPASPWATPAPAQTPAPPEPDAGPMSDDAERPPAG